MLIPVILAGGVGSRLWPVSRALLPKQFIQFPQHQATLFQQTLQRLDGFDVSPPVVICNGDHRFLVAEQLRQIGIGNGRIVLEPVGRNTAPAAAVAALLAQQQDPGAMLLVLPADHVINDIPSFHKALTIAIQHADNGKLVTFGVVPVSAQTGYGYIEKGDVIGETESFQVARFVEKPDRATAESYLASGNYLWNSGMFLFRADVFLQELGDQAPDMLKACREAVAAAVTDPDFERLGETQFAASPGDSIDYAVMEKTRNGAVVALDAGWNDLGSWAALWESDSRDNNNNVLSGDVFTADVSNSYLQAQSRLLAAVGLSDTVVVETADAVLVAARDRVQDVKAIVDQLQAAAREEVTAHTLVYRPWGSYQSLARGEGYQVKHIVVNPGAALSLQLHHRRAEHWTAIRGTAVVQCDEREFELAPNESTFIPLGAKHRLSNRSTEPVEIIEVQVGDYLGEDDIVRFEDRYGRTR
ncbi:MAG: mannose-1-phosphate guanylyltransferase/mannose-6-phosphate isomerase [Gammaproteobacteria bacterium]